MRYLGNDYFSKEIKDKNTGYPHHYNLLRINWEKTTCFRTHYKRIKSNFITEKDLREYLKKLLIKEIVRRVK